MRSGNLCRLKSCWGECRYLSLLCQGLDEKLQMEEFGNVSCVGTKRWVVTTNYLNPQCRMQEKNILLHVLLL